MRRHRLLRVAALAFIVGGSTVMAQPGSPDAGEFSFHTGLLAGLGTHASVGGSAGRAFSRYATLLIDTSYSPLSTRTLKSYPGVVLKTSRLYDFNAAVHVRVPLRGKDWEPYGILGSGLLFNTYEKQLATATGELYYEGKSACAFGFQTGGGVRYFLKPEWGLRAEYRYTVSSSNFSRIAVGIFYQFTGEMP
jgi:opacity protein-like surface antigen